MLTNIHTIASAVDKNNHTVNKHKKIIIERLFFK